MAVQTIAQLKSRFATGAKPTQQDFANVFDSFVHVNNLATANNAAIDARITAYDGQLKATTSGGTVASLGDVLSVFQGWDSADKVIAKIGAGGGGPTVNWGNLSGRPESVLVTWDEQQISVDTYLANNPPPLPTNVMQLIRPVSIVQTMGQIPAAKKTVIRDISVTAFPVMVAGTSFQNYAHRINSVTIGVDPRVGFGPVTP